MFVWLLQTEIAAELCFVTQAKVQVVDVDEAKRRFWRVILGLERDAGEEPEVPSKPHYSSELQPSIMVLDQMCSAIIESLEGVLTPP
jgi:hypothetical protein